MRILEHIPRKNNVLNLEPPALDEDIIVEKVETNDNFLKDYQNLTSGALAAISIVFNDIVNQDPLIKKEVMNMLTTSIKLLSQLMYTLTQSRRYRVMNIYTDKTQKLIKKTEATDF